MDKPICQKRNGGHHHQAASLIETIIAIGLGTVLVLMLMHVYQVIYHSYQLQQGLSNITRHALMATKQIQSALDDVRGPHCEKARVQLEGPRQSPTLVIQSCLDTTRFQVSANHFYKQVGDKPKQALFDGIGQWHLRLDADQSTHSQAMLIRFELTDGQSKLVRPWVLYEAI